MIFFLNDLNDLVTRSKPETRVLNWTGSKNYDYNYTSFCTPIISIWVNEFSNWFYSNAEFACSFRSYLTKWKKQQIYWNYKIRIMQHFFKIKILIHSTSFTFTNQTHTCLYFNKLSNLIIFTNYQIKCKSISGIF